MSMNLLLSFLGWVTVLNLGILLLWLTFFITLHNWVYAIHHRFFNITPNQFDAIHYSCMGLLKLITLLFFLIPYITLRFII